LEAYPMRQFAFYAVFGPFKSIN